MSNAQLEAAIQDLRETLNEIYNAQAEMKESIRELRFTAGLSSDSSMFPPAESLAPLDTIP